MWIISNIKNLKFNTVNCLRFENYNYYYDEFLSGDNNTSLTEFIAYGHASVNKDTDKISLVSIEDEIANAYKLYGSHFIQHIKGNFIILQLLKNGFKVYSDRFAVKKFFYWHNGCKFIISDNLKGITKNVRVIPSPNNMVIYTLTYHFTGGTTLFEGVKHNTPAQIIEYTNKELKFGHYWNPSELLLKSKSPISIDKLSACLENVVGESIVSLDGKISLSLTGGSDTRNLLALFLRKGIKPHLYTYGNPESNDCRKASSIAKGLNLNHSVFDISMSAELFEHYSRKIICLSGGLASIHRAHRFMAVEMESRYSNNMFLGTLGGEFIRGVSEDDYIIPSLVYNNWNNPRLSTKDLYDYIEQKSILRRQIDLNGILDFLSNEPYMSGSMVKRKFNALAYITAHLHDAQDVNLYNSIMDNVFTPYLDIDYLNTVFSSFYSFDIKESMKNKFLKRIDNPVYASRFLNVTYKPLLKYEYCGGHKPSEVIFNKYYAAIVKSLRKRIRSNYPLNFPLDNWMKKFVEKHLPSCADYEILNNTFNIEALVNDLKRSVHLPKESYWLKYTNPVMMRFIIDEFKS